MTSTSVHPVRRGFFTSHAGGAGAGGGGVGGAGGAGCTHSSRTASVPAVIAALMVIVFAGVAIATGIVGAARGWLESAAGGYRGSVAKLLHDVRVQPQRPTITGYSRDEFGGWRAAGACDTRQRVLVEWFGGSGCDIAGEPSIADPYSGAVLVLDDVDVDHIFPLAAAWDFGASQWEPAQRREFANDIEDNLIPTASAVNREKSDLTPAEWMPGNPDVQCEYAFRFVSVAVKWDLAVSVDDWSVMAKSCEIRRIG